ncbi:hypothetical protein M404DRAFT_998548, partial [Pisolithus tinctorius Marx 270]
DSTISEYPKSVRSMEVLLSTQRCTIHDIHKVIPLAYSCVRGARQDNKTS